MSEEQIESQTDDAEETEDQEGAIPEQDASGEDPAREPRAERQSRRGREFREFKEKSAAEVERLRAEVAERDERMARLMEKMAETQAQTAAAVSNVGKAPPKPFKDTVRERLTKAAAGVRADDPESAQRYIDEQTAIIMEAAERVAEEKSRAIAAEYQAKAPRPVSPEAQKYIAMTDGWIQEDDNIDAVEVEVKRLARMGNRNLKDKRVMHATVTEAIAKVAKENNLPFHAPARSGGPDASAVVGSGTRTFGASESGGGEMTDFARKMADNHPLTKHLPPSKRYKAFQRDILDSD